MAAGSIEHEGSDMGVGDFVLLSEITMHAFIENLKLRWSVSSRHRTRIDPVHSPF